MIQEGETLFRKETALPADQPSESAIRDWCIDYIKRTVDDASIAVGPDIPFEQMGLDSATSAYFIVELEEWVGNVELYPEMLGEHPTIAELARHVAGIQSGDGT